MWCKNQQFLLMLKLSDYVKISNLYKICNHKNEIYLLHFLTKISKQSNQNSNDKYINKFIISIIKIGNKLLSFLVRAFRNLFHYQC